MMTPTRRLVYRFFFQTVLLLFLLALVTLWNTLRLSPPLNTFAHLLRHLTILTGLLGGGLYIATTYRTDNQIADETALRVAAGLWTILLLVALIAGLSGQLPSWLTLLLVVNLTILLTLIGRIAPHAPVIHLWLLGLGISAAGMLLGLLPPANEVQVYLLPALITNLQFNVAYPLAAVALGFWLMHRFSNITPDWANRSLYSVAAFIVLAGTLVSLAPLAALSTPDWVEIVSNCALFIIPVACWMVAAHSYRALSDRNATHTLAAHWFSLALLLLLLGPGFLGALQTPFVVSRWTLGTRLTAIQHTLTAWMPIALSLGVINQAAAEMRGRNWRVTGLIPFWLVSFGIIGLGLAESGAGLVQTYLERIVGLPFAEVQRLLTPLDTLAAVGWLSVILGIAIYTLTLWLRRPRSTVE
ncbi:MAG TPA: hypothetical protein VHO69_03680 [Phototrophicaceae bacterium]|nr:hypothetical protein [Phototrophicaceae bacterium]